MKIISRFCLSLIVLPLYFGCNKIDNTETHILKIDTSISQMAIARISYEGNINVEKNYFYADLNAEYFENEKKDKVEQGTHTVFFGKYTWEKDILNLSVFYGDLGSIGFSVNISKDTTGTVYFQQCGHTVAKFRSYLWDTLSVCAKIPCTFSRLVISKFPNKSGNDIVHGYIDLASHNFYFQQHGSNIKLRRNLRFYFQARLDYRQRVL